MPGARYAEATRSSSQCQSSGSGERGGSKTVNGRRPRVVRSLSRTRIFPAVRQCFTKPRMPGPFDSCAASIAARVWRSASRSRSKAAGPRLPLRREVLQRGQGQGRPLRDGLGLQGGADPGFAQVGGIVGEPSIQARVAAEQPQEGMECLIRPGRPPGQVGEPVGGVGGSVAGGAARSARLRPRALAVGAEDVADLERVAAPRVDGLRREAGGAEDVVGQRVAAETARAVQRHHVPAPPQRAAQAAHHRREVLLVAIPPGAAKSAPGTRPGSSR